MSGHVNKPGNFEVCLGMPFSELLELAGGVRGGRKLKAVIPGGSSMPVLPGDIMLATTYATCQLQQFTKRHTKAYFKVTRVIYMAGH